MKRKKTTFRRPAKSTKRPPPTTIADLTLNLVDEILVRLPIRDAIGTSLISRAWRHRWRSIPDLAFHDLPPLFVSNALLLHSAPLRAFELVTPEASPSAANWLFNLSLRGAVSLRSLVLRFCIETPEYDRDYLLQSSVFSSSNLTNISLFNCHVVPPHGFIGFKHLRSLQLEKVDFEGGGLSALISASLVLKTVCLIQVDGGGCLKIRGPSIRRLDYRDVYFDNFLLGSCPVLSYVNISLNHEFWQDYQCDHDDNGEESWLHLGQESSKIAVRGITEMTSVRFNHLLAMTLGINFADVNSISAAIRLLRSCPNLQTLTVERCSNWFGNGVDGSKDIWDAQGQFNLFPKLQTVEIRDVKLEESELEFIRVILETGEMLETLMLHFSNKSISGNELDILKLSEYRRASNRARVLFPHLEFV